MQTITSAKTSIKQVPALHKKAVKEGYISGYDAVLDYGCGAYDDGLNYLEDYDIASIGYDKFNRPAQYNAAALQALNSGEVTVVLCANVLNVIREKSAREDVIADCAKAGRVALFTTYEGDRTGEGRETSKGWQNNRKTDSYIDELLPYFAAVARHGNVLIAIPHKRK